MPLDDNSLQVSAPSGATPAATYPTLAAVITHVSTWGLTLQQQAQMLSGLRLLERLFGQPAMLIVMDPAVIGPKLEGASAAACGLKASSLPVYKTLVRTAMRRLDLIDMPSRLRTPLSPAWAALRAGLPANYLSLRLQSFMEVCDAHGISPDQVDEAALLLHTQVLRERRLTRNPAGSRAKVVQAWNAMFDIVPGWPQRRLANPITRQPKTIPPAHWTVLFADDVKRFVREASKPEDGAYFSRETEGRVLRPQTIRTRLEGIRKAVTLYVAIGNSLEALVSLEQLLVPEVMRKIMEQARRDSGLQLTPALAHLGSTFRSIARYRFPEASPVVTEARRLAKRATPPIRKGLAPRTEERLLQFIDQPERRAALLQLPGALFEEARDLKAAGQGWNSAWKAGVATAISIELRCPLRLHALTHLRLGEELSRVGGDGARWTQFIIEGDINKTEEPLRWPISEKVSKIIDHYVNEYRHLGPHAGTPWLFPGSVSPLAPRHENGFSRAISEQIYRRVGVEMHVHLFRAFAGMLILEDSPEALDDLRRLLGHTTLTTALRYYAFRCKLAAAGRVDAVLERKTVEAKELGRRFLEMSRPQHLSQRRRKL